MAGPERGACLGCRYPLKGLSENVCPECGRAFDPDDPATMYMGRVPGRVGVLLMKPPGWPFIGATTLAACVSMYSHSVPGGYFGLQILLGMAWLLLGIVWILRLCAWAAAKARFRRRAVRADLRWLVPPVIVVATLLLEVYDVPARARFAMSRSAMERFARQVMTSPNAEHRSQFVGLYSADDILAIDGGMSFEIRGSGFINMEGFAYLPNGPPAKSQSSSRRRWYKHFSGDWYTYVEVF